MTHLQSKNALCEALLVSVVYCDVTERNRVAMSRHRHIARHVIMTDRDVAATVG
jgi:hypothetical protein